MALYVNTNVASLNSQRNLMRSTNELSGTFQRLSSGYRINSAKDDAAGLAISTRMTAQILGLNQAVRNANDGISLVQVAEGALDETTNALQRIRELAVQSANTTYSDGDRAFMQKEAAQLMSEIDRIAKTTQFNKQNLLTGEYTDKYFQVGALSGQVIRVSIGAASIGGLLSAAAVAFVDSLIGTSVYAASALKYIDSALDRIADLRSNLGAMQNRFEAVVSNLSNVSENTSASRSRIMDADIARETAELTRSAIMQQAGAA
ncbi:flagellin, partial [Candidatus Magnetobacterium casense]|uniref:flagellin N-terminal helical domain-containing protein n=1 Tax=Candidatus Magnetobacterium casense TaxID=1455061 RepID=UPI00058F22ED